MVRSLIVVVMLALVGSSCGSTKVRPVQLSTTTATTTVSSDGGSPTTTSSTSGQVGTATLTLDPAHPLDPTSRTVTVLATEQACAGGQPPTGRTIDPDVQQTAEGVTITVTVVGVGIATCPMNPAFPVTVQLDKPLGSRQILDGSSHPPHQVLNPSPGIPTTTAPA